MHTIPPTDDERKRNAAMAVEATYWGLWYALTGDDDAAHVNLALAEKHATEALRDRVDITV